jgi:hypothetical protein
MIRRYPQRPQRRQHRDFHFFAAPDPIANLASQFPGPPETIQPPSETPAAPAPIQLNEPAVPAEPKSVFQRAVDYLADIDDPRQLKGLPPPPFLDELKALAATRKSAPARPSDSAEVSRSAGDRGPVQASQVAARTSGRRAARSDKPNARKAPGKRRRRVPAPAHPSGARLDRSHHERHCKICTHRDRDDIEADFIEWRAPDNILRDYNVSRAALYRHVRALGLYARRNAYLRFGLGRLIECVDHVDPTADSIVRAIHAFARINDDGQWVEPPAHVIVSSGGIRRQAAAPGANRPLAITLDSPVFPSAIDVSPNLAALPGDPGALSRDAGLPETHNRVETDATR